MDLLPLPLQQVMETKVYAKHAIPGFIYTTSYDIDTNNYPYRDTDSINHWVSTGEHGEWKRS